MKNYLIIGNSAGGIGASEAIREVDKKGSITIVSDEPYHTYSRPMISEYLSHERTYEQMFFRPSDFYSKNGISFLPGKKVQKLDLDNKSALLDDNQKLTWDSLLLACGGQPIVPRTEGGDKKGIFSFTTLDDARKLDRVINKGSRAVVIGGGLIGMSLTQALVKRGVKVAVVELKDYVLNTILDARASSLMEEKLQAAGVRLIMSHTVARILGRSAEVEGVELDNGERIDCELLVFAIGVAPRLELVKKPALSLSKWPDISINRGILADRCMKTSHPDVYACGDMVEGYDFLLKTNRLLPIWPAAYIGGRTAGFNMAGQNKEYDGATVMNALNYFSYPLVAAGLVNLEKEEGYEVMTSIKSSMYRKVVLKDNRIVGLLYTGIVDRAGIVFGLMKDGVDVSAFKGELISPSFGMASMPEALRKERMNLIVNAHEKDRELQRA